MRDFFICDNDVMWRLSPLFKELFIDKDSD